jgi:hypothetical protein
MEKSGGAKLLIGRDLVIAEQANPRSTREHDTTI